MKKFKIEYYADGANIKNIKIGNKNNKIKGFTTNPSLMKLSGIKNYKKFAKEILKIVKIKPVSFEIFADEAHEIEAQARIISSWGKNVFVKIPIINTKGISNAKLIGKLNKENIKLNVTAVFLPKQSVDVVKYIGKKTDIIISVFAGRIADSGRDPVIELKKHINLAKNFKNIKILWASVREPLNLIQAQNIGCHIITVPQEILKKTKNFNKDLFKYSKETVKMFYDDAKKSGFSLK
jgi:transaldolase